MAKKIIFYILLTVILISSCGKTTDNRMAYQNLNGRWEFRKVGDSLWNEATVPGNVHTDLYKNVLIGDPFYRTNEKDLQWIGEENWEYRKVFYPDNDLINRNQIRLNFEGLDTYAQVYLNDSLILDVDNMFRDWEVEVTKLLRPGVPNTLEILFTNVFDATRIQYDTLGYQLPAANDQAERKVSPFVRKAPYHFGWDWGPRFVSCGIWKPVHLQAWDGFKLSDGFFKQLNISQNKAELRFIGQVNSLSNESSTLSIWATHPITKEKTEIKKAAVSIKKGDNNVSIDFSIDDPELWWPNGMGEPNLYRLEAQLKAGNAVDSYRANIGLREVELIQEPDSFGRSFFFKVNGHPVFAKGANYIPQDVFTNHVVSKEYEHLIHSAKAANMNMLRVWGGGIYELDYFYDLCDKNGIMVWQDFMFACTMYPGNQAFLESVEQEAIDNVKRLRNHPSIVLWCGNNEVQDAWFRWGWQGRQSDAAREEISTNYQKIFLELLPNVLANLDPDRPYWPSSPAYGDQFGQTSTTQSGDYHYWGVWHGRRPFESYAEEIPRFSSEYGFQSFPSTKTIESFTLPADRNLESEVMRSHQRHPIGNQLILDYMERYYPVPEDFNDFVYMSQVMQGEGIRFGIEALRRNRPQCMGSLYWQLNDCWPVASWSGIDFFGRWKALHYQAQRAYKNQILSFEIQNDSVKLFFVSDSLSSTSGHLKVEVSDFYGGIINSYEREASFPANSSEIVWQEAMTELSINPAKAKRLFISADFVEASSNKSLKTFIYPALAKDQFLPEASISWELKALDEGLFIHIQSKYLTRQVQLEYRGATEVRFENNFFDLLPGEEKLIQIHKRSRDHFNRDQLLIRSLNDFVKLND